jgi:HlyD family secretion protein
MKRASSTSRSKGAQSPSREAAQGCSPGRNPWVQVESDAALNEPKNSCGPDSFSRSAIVVSAATTWQKQAAGKADVSTAGAEALVSGKSLWQGPGPAPPKTASPKTKVFLEPVKSVPFRAHRAALRLRPTLSLVLLPLLFLLSCAKNSGEKEAAVPVQVVTVKKKTVQRTVTAEAVLFPLQQAAITPKISAPVKAFYIKRGSRVHKGQLLAVLENTDLAAAAQENKGSYDQAQAAYETTTVSDLPQQVQKAQLDAQAAKQLFDAQQKIYSSRQELFQQGAMPRKELDQAGVDLTNARNQYEIAQKHLDALMVVGKQQQLKSAAGQLESARGKYLGAAAQLSYSEVRSPIDGVVTDRPLYPAEMAAAGTPLLTVMDISQVIARAHIPQPEAALLKGGDKATVTVPGQEDPIEGNITVVSPALDPNSTTVEVWVQVKNSDQRLKPGTSVQVSMLAETIPDALVIPAAALLTAPDGTTSVMQVSADSRAHPKNIKVGIRQGDEVQVVEGLQAGDQIVATGAYGLPDNTRIKAESPPAAQPADKSGKSDEK